MLIWINQLFPEAKRKDRECNPNQYISNMVDGSTAGYRWFDFRTAREISTESRGTAEGEFVVRDGRNGPVAARIQVTPSENWKIHTAPLAIEKGKHALYFTFEGTGAADFRSFSFGWGQLLMAGMRLGCEVFPGKNDNDHLAWWVKEQRKTFDQGKLSETGIIALDACPGHSGSVNMLVPEDE